MTAKDDKRDVFAVGEEFRGYVIERLLGKGGLGAVYLARHKLLETRFASAIQTSSQCTMRAWMKSTVSTTL